MLLRAHNIFYARIHWQDLPWINYNVVPGNRLSDIKPNHFWPITYTACHDENNEMSKRKLKPVKVHQ